MRRRGDFPRMDKIIPASERGAPGTFYIHHHKVTEAESRRTMLGGALTFVPQGAYCALKRASSSNDTWDTIWMSDTPFEHGENIAALRAATGDVLVVGLGIGMVSLAMCRKKEVRSVTVLEIEPDVVRLVAPHVKHRKLRVILADGTMPPLRGRHYDFIYLDIWPNICADNWTGMKPMLAMYRKHRRPGGFVDAWMKQYTQTESSKQERWY